RGWPRTTASSREAGCVCVAPRRSGSTVSDQSALRTAVIIDLIFLFEFLELLDHPVVLIVVQSYQRFPFAAKDQNPLLIGLRLQNVVGFAFDLHDVVDDVAFLFAGLLVDQLDGLHFPVRFRNLWHSASWCPTRPIVEIPLQQ